MNGVLITYTTGTEKKAEYFCTYASMWKWLTDFRNKTGAYPSGMCVHECNCVFDGS